MGWLVATLENGTLVSGLSVLGATLLGNGIPSESALEYEAAVRSNRLPRFVTSGITPGAGHRQVAPRVHWRPRSHPRVVGLTPRTTSAHWTYRRTPTGLPLRVHHSVSRRRC